MLLEQFENAINGDYESVDAMKTALTEVFPSIKSAFEDNKTQRKDLGSKYDNTLKTLEKIGKTLGLENYSDYSVEDIKAKFDSIKSEKNVDYDKKLSDEVEKYRREFNEELAVAQKDALDAKEKLNSFEHRTLIDKSNLLKDVKDDTPLFKEQAMSYLMSQTMVKDGRLVVNDGNGTPAKDLKSGDLLSGDFVVSKMKEDSVYAPLFKSQQKDGMGTPANQVNSGLYSNQTKSSLDKISGGLGKL